MPLWQHMAAALPAYTCRHNAGIDSATHLVAKRTCMQQYSTTHSDVMHALVWAHIGLLAYFWHCITHRTHACKHKSLIGSVETQLKSCKHQGRCTYMWRIGGSMYS